MTVPDRSATGRRQAVALAGLRGDPGPARAALSDPEPAVRAAALGALARAGGLSEPELRAGLLDPEPAVRARAAEVAVTGDGTAAAGGTATAVLGDIEVLLDDTDAAVVEAACFALGELAASSAVGALSSVAGSHPDALCREAAVAALGCIGAPEGRAAVLAATADKPTVRRRAVLALAAFDGEEVDAALERALTDRDWQVRQAAEDLTGRRPASGPATS